MDLYMPDDYVSFSPNPTHFQSYSDLISTGSFHEKSRGNHRHCKLKPKSHFQMLGKPWTTETHRKIPLGPIIMGGKKEEDYP